MPSILRNTLITTETSAVGSPETIAIDLGSPDAAYIVIDDIADTAYAIDNLTVYRYPDVIFRDRFVNQDHLRWSVVVGMQVEP